VIILQDGATDEAFSRLPPSASVGLLARDIQAQIQPRKYLVGSDLPGLSDSALQELARKLNIKADPSWSWQKLTEAIHETAGEPVPLASKEVYVIVNQTVKGAPPGFHPPSKSAAELLELAQYQGLDVDPSWSREQLIEAIQSVGKKRRFIQL